MSTAAPNSSNKTLDPWLPPPSFALPKDFDQNDKNRYELWTVRIPRTVNLTALQGQTVNFDTSTTCTQQPCTTITLKNDPDETDGTPWEWQFGSPNENESFRLLVPTNKKKQQRDDSSSDSDDSDDDPLQSFRIHPYPRPFDRHVTLVQHLEIPSTTSTPQSTTTPTEYRQAYATVPQRPGLKRRWTPIGDSQKRNVPGTTMNSKSLSHKHKRDSDQQQQLTSPNQQIANVPPTAPLSPKHTPATDGTIPASHDDDSVDKRARKEAKKAKKKAKKEKKSAKKKAKKDQTLQAQV